MTSRREPDVSVVMPVRHAHAHVDANQRQARFASRLCQPLLFMVPMRLPR